MLQEPDFEGLEKLFQLADLELDVDQLHPDHTWTQNRHIDRLAVSDALRCATKANEEAHARFSSIVKEACEDFEAKVQELHLLNDSVKGRQEDEARLTAQLAGLKETTEMRCAHEKQLAVEARERADKEAEDIIRRAKVEAEGIILTARAEAVSLRKHAEEYANKAMDWTWVMSQRIVGLRSEVSEREKKKRKEPESEKAQPKSERKQRRATEEHEPEKGSEAKSGAKRRKSRYVYVLLIL